MPLVEVTCGQVVWFVQVDLWRFFNISSSNLWNSILIAQWNMFLWLSLTNFLWRWIFWPYFLYRSFGPSLTNGPSQNKFQRIRFLFLFINSKMCIIFWPADILTLNMFQIKFLKFLTHFFNWRLFTFKRLDNTIQIIWQM